MNPETIPPPDAVTVVEEVRTSVLQYQEIVRVMNPQSDDGCGSLIRDVTVRQYLPVSDRVQILDWYVLSDLDPRLTDVDVRTWSFAGGTNRYIQWTIGEIEPGECVQLGYVAGMRTKENIGPDGKAVFRPRMLDAPDMSPLSPQLNLSSLCQYMPTSRDWTTGFAGLEPVAGTPSGEEGDFWAGALDRSMLFTVGPFWDSIDAQLESYFAGIDAWYTRSKATRIAALVCAVVAAQPYGQTSEDEDTGGFFRSTHPGSPHWPRVLGDALRVLWDLVEALAQGDDEVLGTSGSIHSLEAWAEGRLELYGALACRCTTRAFQALWILRLARIPCRELGGQRLDQDGALSETGLPGGASVGHRIVEVWDEDNDDWFAMETTRPDVGPTIPWFLTKVRGCTSPEAPLSWAYATHVFEAERWSDSVAGPAFLERASILHDDSPEGSGWGSYYTAGDWWRVNRGHEEDSGGRLDHHEWQLRIWLDDSDVRFGLAGSRMDPADAAAIKQHLVDHMDSMEASLDGRRWFPLWALWFAPVRIPGPENFHGIGPSTASSFVAFVITLAGPQVAVDHDLWFARTYLLLPDPYLPALQAPLASPQRVASSSPDWPHHGPFGSRIGPRGGWAWNFLGNLLYFVGSPVEAPEGDQEIRYDCRARMPGVYDKVHPVFATGLFGPPFPTDLGSVPVAKAAADWVKNLSTLADSAAYMGRDPVAALGLMAPGAAGSLPGDVEQVYDWLRERRQFIINPWGDLAVALRELPWD